MHQVHSSEFAKDPHLETCLNRGACRVRVGSEWAYPSDGGRRSFLPDDLPNCLCEPVVPMFEGGLREVTTDNIETSLCFDGLKYGGLLEMAALTLMFNCPKRGCTREPEDYDDSSSRGHDHACKSHRQDAGHELTLVQASSSSSGSTALLICVGQGWVPGALSELRRDQEGGKSKCAQDLNHAPSLPRAASHSGLPLLAVLGRYAAGTAAIIGKILRGRWFLVGGNRKRQNKPICAQPLVRLVCWLWHPRQLA